MVLTAPKALAVLTAAMMVLSGTLILTTDQVRDPSSSDPQTGMSNLGVWVQFSIFPQFSGEFFNDENSLRVFSSLGTLKEAEYNVYDFGCLGMEINMNGEVEMQQYNLHTGDLFVVGYKLYLATHDFTTQACLVGTADIDESDLPSFYCEGDKYFWVWRMF